MTEAFESCYRAISAKDPRFDGWFFIAVSSTGIYCRPSCPAMTPRREHVRFYPSAAACQQAGFRACKRCRPDAAPGSPEWNARGDVVARAMRLIAVRAVFALTPTELRRRSADRAGASRAARRTPAPSLQLRLSFRRPLNPENLFGHLAATAIPGVEEIRGATYRRTLRLPHGSGIAALTPQSDHISCRLRLDDMRDLSAAIARCRWLLDLDADPEAIDEQLSTDRRLRPFIARAPGRRVPRSVDGAEMAIRAVLGQQISTAAARTHAARLAAEHGERIDDPDGSLTRLFPTPEALADADLAMPAARTRTVKALIAALTEGRLDLSPAADRAETMARLEALPGIGPWTRDIIAMRALGDPDAFPAADLGVRRGADALALPTTRLALVAHAERWRPWRAYGVQHLWAATAHPINQWPPDLRNGSRSLRMMPRRVGLALEPVLAGA